VIALAVPVGIYLVMALGVFWLSFEHTADEMQRRNLAPRRRGWPNAKANNAKSAFLANMSHESGTPLNGILGCTEILLDMSPSPQQKPYLDMLRDAEKLLLTIINDILDFSKLRRRSSPWITFRWNWPRSCAAAWIWYARNRSKRAETRNVDRARSAGMADGRSGAVCARFCSICWAMPSNHPKRGIWLRSRPMTEVPPSAFPSAIPEWASRRIASICCSRISRRRIIGRLWRHRSGTSHLQKTGRGDGRLDRHGKRVRPGSLFWFTIPLAAAEIPASRIETGAATAATERRKVLVAEDVKVNQVIIERLLTRAGHEVTLVENGAEASKRCAPSPMI